jgi:hypothetical protein
MKNKKKAARDLAVKYPSRRAGSPRRRRLMCINGTMECDPNKALARGIDCAGCGG